MNSAALCLGGMERLWSLAGATSGNRWQMHELQNLQEQAKTVATGCDQLPLKLDGKEGVDGSSPSEGSAKAAEIAAFCVDGTCTSPSMWWVWSRLWSFQIQNALLVSAITARTRISTRPRASTPVPPPRQISRRGQCPFLRGRLKVACGTRISSRLSSSRLGEDATFQSQLERSIWRSRRCTVPIDDRVVISGSDVVVSVPGAGADDPGWASGSGRSAVCTGCVPLVRKRDGDLGKRGWNLGGGGGCGRTSCERCCCAERGRAGCGICGWHSCTGTDLPWPWVSPGASRWVDFTPSQRDQVRARERVISSSSRRSAGLPDVRWARRLPRQEEAHTVVNSRTGTPPMR